MLLITIPLILITLVPACVSLAGQVASGYVGQPAIQPHSTGSSYGGGGSSHAAPSSHGALSYAGPSSSAGIYGPTGQVYQGNTASNTYQVEGGKIHGGTNVLYNSIVTPDGCWRVMTNADIVGAEPYDRKSFVTQKECLQRCIDLQNSGAQVASYNSVSGYDFTCRSLVYDAHQHVCDIYAHTGSQYPASFAKAYGKHYVEWTGECDGGTGSGSSCPSGDIERYIRIIGFEMQGDDTATLNGVSEQACIDACTNNQVSGGSCLSFDYVQSSRECRLSTNAVVPVGSGRLAPRAGTSYYEKICVNEADATGCAEVFDRFPQMILVGFAESVITTNSFEECLDACLAGQTQSGDRCASGMYYFELSTMNCILNRATRNTRPDLFTEENLDIVDYFEPGCPRARLFSQRLSTVRRRPSKVPVEFNSDQFPHLSRIDVVDGAFDSRFGNVALNRFDLGENHPLVRSSLEHNLEASVPPELEGSGRPLSTSISEFLSNDMVLFNGSEIFYPLEAHVAPSKLPARPPMAYNRITTKSRPVRKKALSHRELQRFLNPDSDVVEIEVEEDRKEVTKQEVRLGEWTAWTPCSLLGKRLRYMQCGSVDVRLCRAETARC